jgi:hypothetical protein
MKKYLLLLLCLGFVTSCAESTVDCSLVLCTGPPIFLLEILSDGENVIENGTYTLETISVDGTDSNNLIIDIRTWQTGSGEKTGILIDNQNWEPKVYDLNLNLASDSTIPIQLDIDLSEAESCCGGIPRVSAVLINGEIQSANNSTIFTIEIN